MNYTTCISFIIIIGVDTSNVILCIRGVKNFFNVYYEEEEEEEEQEEIVEEEADALCCKEEA